MKNVFKSPGPPVAVLDVDRIARSLRLERLNRLALFYCDQNGGIPERFAYSTGKRQFFISHFLPFETDDSEGLSAVDVYRSLVVDSNVSRYLWPFAIDIGGKPFVVDLEAETLSVLLLLNDLGSELRLVPVSDSLTQFLATLTESDE